MLLVLDVGDALATLLEDGLPDPVRFLEDFSGLIKEAKAAKAEHPRIAFWGECLGRLRAEGKTDAAILLEQGCDELAKTFSKASVQDTQPFTFSDIVRPNSRLTCRGSVTFCKSAQFSFRHSELRSATIQTDNNLWKYPHDRLVNVLQAAKMDAYLPGKLVLVH